MNGSERALIEFRGVDVAFGDHLVLGKLSLEVRRGEIVCVVGPSGCGKTTALRVASGLIRPTRGEVAFAGVPIKAPRRDVAVVFQDYSKALLPWRTAAGNVALALEATGTPGAERADRIAQLLTRVGLGAFAQKYPSRFTPADISEGPSTRSSRFTFSVISKISPTICCKGKPGDKRSD